MTRDQFQKWNWSELIMWFDFFVCLIKIFQSDQKYDHIIAYDHVRNITLCTKFIPLEKNMQE